MSEPKSYKNLIGGRWVEPSGGQIVFGQLGPEPARGISHHRFDARIERLRAPANLDAKRVLLDVFYPA